ncbi:hypothetical protein O6H91_19G003400 [Diphasiastrum complanatum]|uniref:Uncharacterized protein n=1 Tax=Diphasiastrum complanatum TaxID=34168 RepID=A0ACC2AS96_DIPCM|nr:hypothetical protein O6H91_Y276000 [Diphasiastrum complanatum]KAJ7520383.1 hypothetical protein O6H91_19G003400 [Diphasiastrum complanatum]
MAATPSVGGEIWGDRRSMSSKTWEDSVFGRSSTVHREEDDEEALKWAAIEKLPTYDRLRTAVLKNVAGDGKVSVEEIDVRNLGFADRQHFIDKILHVTEEDNERFLLKLRDRIDKVGIEMPRIEVRFQHLNVDANVYVGSRALPTLLNFTTNMIEGLLNSLHLLPSKKKVLNILNDISGIIKPSRMTLLLGPPNAGKTTLLLALAGKLDPELKVSGRITYNGYDLTEFVPRRTAAYISQHDLHIGEMTVRETLDFSGRCQGVGTRYEMLMELSRREKAAGIKPDPDIDIFMKATALEGQETSIVTDYILKILGLDICADTLVGDEMRRGISGGQKKRLTTGEMLVGPAKALFMDEISTGLDSSTTYQIVKCLRQTVHVMDGTMVVSLLQPAPETFGLFDDLILLSEGQIVYQGPRDLVLDFFESMGFKCPERKGVADFLQEVTSRKDQRQYWADKSKPYRELILIKRNYFIYIFKTFQITFIGTITMTTFLRTQMHHKTVADANKFMGALFYGLIIVMFNGFAELALTVFRLPVFYKQRDLMFYPSWAFTLPTWVLRVPMSFYESFIWVFLTYWVIGYDPEAGRFFRQYMLLFFVHNMSLGLFRFLASMGRTMIVASTFGSFALLVVFVLGGFILARGSIHPWWIWGYWISPLMYGQNALAVNEFLGKRWRHPVSSLDLEPVGVALLKSRGIFPQWYWYWIGIGALIGYAILFNILFTLALTYLNPLGKPQAIVTKESIEEKNANSTGEGVDPQNNSLSRNNELKVRRSSLSSADGNVEEVIAAANADGAAAGRRGMVLPFQPLAMAFDHINYYVDMPPEMKQQGEAQDRLQLLRDVSGAFRPGVLTALVGVSGAGKTTLMDVLAGRKTGGYIEGSISISGFPKNQETFARIAGYCEQNDIHSPNVTVHESLIYSAWLRLPKKVDKRTRVMFVEEVMELVELSPLRDGIVGLPGVTGLSTEQRKRLTIAVELVANPSIIFMDEPTSGLDARAAAIVMRTVRNTVDTGRTVVCTIHQPSIDIFEAFDELLLMKRGGQVIYAGSLGKQSQKLVDYFQAVDGVPAIAYGYNPATWMLDVSSQSAEVRLGVDFAEIYRNSTLYRQNEELIKALSTPSPDAKDLYFETQYAQTFEVQCLACLWKQHRSYWRNPLYCVVRMFFTTICALMFGTIFWNLGTKRGTQQDLFNLMGSMYAAILFIGVNNSSSVQPVVGVERTVFYRERAAGMYSAFPYAFGQVIIEIPYVFVQTIVYGLIVYSMIAFQWTVAKFFWYLYFMFCTFMYFTYYGMMAVSLTPNHQFSAIVSSAFIGLWNLFSGFLVTRPNIPVWWRWFVWIDPFAWTLNGLITSQLGDVTTPLKIPGQDDRPRVKDFLRSYFGFHHSFLPVIAVVEIGLVLMFAFIFAICIKNLNFQKR